jgi:hypothetical protein
VKILVNRIRGARREGDLASPVSVDNIGLIFGWQPIPTTTLGCSLHKRFPPLDRVDERSPSGARLDPSGHGGGDDVRDTLDVDIIV